jgi:hypothetical protein
MRINGLAWHGEPIDVKFGYVGISPNKDKPMWWYNYECNLFGGGYATIPAIEIKQDGHIWYIANHFNIGMNKLRRGGWPNLGHKSLDGDGFTFSEIKNKEDLAMIIEDEFDEEGYAKHESEREKWQRDNFGDTEDFKKSQALKRMIKDGAMNKFYNSFKND